MSHPSSIDLEAFASGEPVAAVETHLGGCARCAAFVERLKTALARGPSRAVVAERIARAAAAPANPPPRVRRLWPAVSVALPLAAAAAVLLFLKRDLGTSPLPSAVAPPASVVAAVDPSSDITFKGGLVGAVIRERDGDQERFTTTVGVRPGDRLRLEVALDKTQPLLAAVLGDDGSWLELMPEGVRPPGTHFSERSAKVDASPLRGTVLAGAPDAVRAARKSKSFDGLLAIPIAWEAR